MLSFARLCLAGAILTDLASPRQLALDPRQAFIVMDAGAKAGGRVVAKDLRRFGQHLRARGRDIAGDRDRVGEWVGRPDWRRALAWCSAHFSRTIALSAAATCPPWSARLSSYRLTVSSEA